MTVAVTLRGALEPVLLDEDFPSIANTLNMAGATGRQFIAADGENGPVLIALNQILTVREVEEDMTFLPH